MTKRYIIYSIITAAWLLLTACSLIYDDVEEISNTTDQKASAYVSLVFRTGGDDKTTRSNPTGGEEGDGQEAGQNYEKSVSNVTLFFYEGTQGDDGVNRTDDITFAAVKYIKVEGISSLTVGPIEIEGIEFNKQYHVLAVANAGDLSDITTLNALKAYTVNTVYTETAGVYSDFVMASETVENPILEIKEGNSQTNPAFTTIDLERLAARVDYKTNNPYTLTDGSQISATITRATLVNLYNQSTYLLKRVANDVTGTNLSYLGDETISNGDETTDNYVIDPNTASKTLPATNASGWYNRYYPSLTDNDNWENWLIKGDKVTNPEDDADTWLRLGYVKENTSSVVAQGEYYSTGVVFEAEYDGLGADFTKGKTFFRVNKSTLYPTLEAAMEGHDADFDPNMTFTDYAGLQTYMNSLTGNDPAGYRAYLKQASESESDYAKYEWKYYKNQFLGYDGDGKPTATTRKVLHDRSRHVTETFLNGRGYYIYWIRHNGGSSVEDFDVTRPMAYAIVRNNIYKLEVKSISKIGSDIPTPEAMYIIIDDSWDGVHELEPTNPN